MLKRIVGGKNSTIIISFLASFLLAMLAINVLPASVENDYLHLVYILNFAFVFIIILISIMVYKLSCMYFTGAPSHREMPFTSQLNRISIINKNVKFVSLTVLVGFIFIFVDRVFIRGIDYSQGLRMARYEWLDTVGGGVFGVLGNVFISLAYIGILLFVLHFQQIKLKKLLLFSILIGVIGHAALNGGRSNLLLALIMFVIGLLLKKDDGLKIKIVSRRSLFLLIILIFGGYYVASIIASSASMGGVSLGELVVAGIESLYGMPDYTFFNVERGYLTNIAIYVFSYLYHGQWTTQIAFELANREGLYSITSMLTIILNSLGVLNLNFENKAFADTGAFISLPGAFYYDFGWTGVFFISIFLGMLLGLVFVLIKSTGRIGVLKMAFIVFVLYLLLLSPILAAYGLSYFYFIIFSFFLFGLVNFFVFKHKYRFL